MIAQGFIGSGMAGVAVTCGVETIVDHPDGFVGGHDPAFGLPGGSYAEVYEPTTQFEGADRIAHKCGIPRRTDAFGWRRSSGPRGLGRGPLRRQIAPVEVQVSTKRATHRHEMFDRDQGMRDTTLERLAGLQAT